MLSFSIQNRLQDRTGKVSEAAGARWRFYPRMMVGSCSNRLCFRGSNSGISRWHLEVRISWQAQYLVSLKGDFTCSAHCTRRCMYVTRINHEIHFAGQAQYLVKLEADSCCSAHCKWPFKCDADQSWNSFCVAGAVFGEVTVWLLLLRAL